MHWNDPLNSVLPLPNLSGRTLLSIAMNGTGTKGVAVGQPYPQSTNYDPPKILISTNAAGTQWTDPLVANIHNLQGVSHDEKELRSVCWAGGSTFWAAGQGGLIYESNNDGVSWDQFLPAPETWAGSFDQFEIQGVAFRDATTGIFVGMRPGPKAYAHVGGSSPSWTDISPINHPEITRLTDVAVNGNVAYAVGVKVVGGVEFGVILVSTHPGTPGSTFSAFTPVSPHPYIPSCTIGEDLSIVPVLNKVVVGSSGVWVGGECGRVWNGVNGSGWTEAFSQTDAHIRGFGISPSGKVFAACQRTTFPGYSIVSSP